MIEKVISLLSSAEEDAQERKFYAQNGHFPEKQSMGGGLLSENKKQGKNTKNVFITLLNLVYPYL